MMTSNVSKAIRAQVDRPSVCYANVKICPLHAHRRTILISVMMMSNVSKTIRAQMDWPSVCHAQRQNMPSTRAQADKPEIDTRRNTALYVSPRKWACRPTPPESFFTNQLFDFLWKVDVRDSSANNMTERIELPAASLSRFSRFLMEIHGRRHAGHALPQISMAKQK